MKEFWNQRYNQEAYAYGKAPNIYFKKVLSSLEPGKILLPAEGEGRNAVFAASLGWEVYAYDFSEIAFQKATQLAQEKKVTINYQIASLSELDFSPEFFDAIALIYVHFPDTVRTSNHCKLLEMVKKGGAVFMEAFSSNHPFYQKQNPAVGGPKMPDQLYNITKLKNDFESLQTINLSEEIVHLKEGQYHNGNASVIRFFGKKPF